MPKRRWTGRGSTWRRCGTQPIAARQSPCACAAPCPPMRGWDLVRNSRWRWGAPFAAGVSRMQELLGAHFAPAQGGRAFTSGAVGRLLQWIAGHAEAGIGQSSWGPTGFAFLPSEVEASRVLAAARSAGVVDPEL